MDKTQLKDAISHIRRVALPAAKAERQDLNHVLTSVRVLMEAGDLAADDALVSLMQDNSGMLLQPGSMVPHGMPPDDLVRQLIVQHLLRKDPEKYIPIVEAIREKTTSRGLKRILERHLKNCRK